MGSASSKTKKEIIRKQQLVIENQSIHINKLQLEINSLKSTIISPTPESIHNIQKVKQDRSYKYLVFSGGAIKGISFGGALGTLNNYVKLYDESHKLLMKGVAGVSAGAIIAALIAIGYTHQELLTIMLDLDTGKLLDNDGYLEKAVNLVDDWGLCDGDFIMNFLGELVARKCGGNKDYTIEQLYKDTGLKLVIVTLDTSNKKSVYLYPGNPIKEYSDIPIRVAIRMSVGLPIVYEPYYYNGCYFSDGGTLDNFPIHVFDGEYPGDPNARLNLCEPNPEVLGMKLMTVDETLDYQLVQKTEFKNGIDFLLSYINVFMTENERRVMTPSFWLRTIIIVTPVFPLSQFTLSDSEKRDLIDIGRKSVRDFFKELVIS